MEALTLNEAAAGRQTGRRSRYGRRRSWQTRWAPDMALGLLMLGTIVAFNARYVIAERFGFERNDVFDTTLWLAFIVSIIGCGRVVYRLAEHAHRRRSKYRKTLRDDDTGSLSIEFLLTFPWMYIMFGIVIQWGLIARAKVVVDYAAYRAARSAITQVETDTWGPLYSMNPIEPETMTSEREPRVREAAALVLAQISPGGNDARRGDWEDYGYGSGRTPAMAMAEAGNPKWPYAMRTDTYERRAAWTLDQLQTNQEGGSGFVVNLEWAPLLDFNTSQFADVAGNAVDALKDMIREYAGIFDGSQDLSPDQSGSWGFTIPMPWPIPDIDIGVGDGDNSSILTDMLGLPSASDIADDLIGMIIDPAADAVLGPMTDALNQLDSQAEAVDPGNPLIPRQARVEIRYPYQLKVPLVASLVHPLWETRSGVTGRFIQIESEVAMQGTGGRAGNLLTLLGGSPIP